MRDDKLRFSFKAHLLGALVGVVPGVFLWLVGAPSQFVIGVVIFGVIIGEIIGVVVGHNSARK